MRSSLLNNKLFAGVDKVVAAADSAFTEEAIRRLREQLSSGAPTYVDNTGSVYSEQERNRETTLGTGKKFNPVEKAVVAEDSACTEEAIRSLREQLAGGRPVMVNEDGTVYHPGYNPGDPTASSLNSNKGFKPTSAAVVAADNSYTDQAIRTLREQLSGGGPISVNKEGAVREDGYPSNPGAFRQDSAAGCAPSDVPDDDEIMALLQGGPSGSVRRERPAESGAVRQGQSFEAPGRPANGNSAEEAVRRFRELLAGNQDVGVAPDGRVQGLAPDSGSSLGNEKPWFNVGGAVVAEEWYRACPALAEAEIRAMHAIAPQAKMGFLPDGRMYWTIHLQPDILGKRKDWTLLAVYESDHPRQMWGGSCHFYPVKPNIAEMQEMVNRSSAAKNKHIPHLVRDSHNQLFLCTQHQDNIHAGRGEGELVTTAAAGLRFAMRWINVFELGLIDETTWELFQDEGKI